MKNRKNSNYKIKFEQPAVKKKPSAKKFYIIFISAFLALAIIIGAIFGIVSAVKNSRAVVKFKGYTLNEAQVGFFASYYKNLYIQSLKYSGVEGVIDNESFWNSKNGLNTYGEWLEYYTKEYIKQLMVAVYIYDRTTSLSKEEKRDIELAAWEKLDFLAEGDVEAFDAATEKYGFAYSDFEDICEIFYKAHSAGNAMFGSDGSKIATETELCKNYFAEYSRVKLLFIRTEKDFKLDENGNRVQENGYDVFVDLTPEEKAIRLVDLETLRNAISALENGGEYQMSPTMYENYLAKYKSGDDYKDRNGYYFHEDSYFTEEYRENVSKELIDTIFEMSVGEFKEVNIDHGYCIIYKYGFDPASAAYADKTDKNGCFDDFYANLAEKTFDSVIDEYTDEVEFTEKYDSFDFIKLPYNTDYYPDF